MHAIVRSMAPTAIAVAVALGASGPTSIDGTAHVGGQGADPGVAFGANCDGWIGVRCPAIPGGTCSNSAPRCKPDTDPLFTCKPTAGPCNTAQGQCDVLPAQKCQ